MISNWTYHSYLEGAIFQKGESNMEFVCATSSGKHSVCIQIDGNDLERIGSGSIEGFLMESLVNHNKKFFDVEMVHLRFPQTTIEWKKRNHGPKEFIVFEHTIPCILNSVIQLQKQGFQVSILAPEG